MTVNSRNSSRLKLLGGLMLVGLAILAWAAIRPGPMAFAGPTVDLVNFSADPTGVPADFAAGDLFARGEYLANAADCLACHTAEGGAAFAGGRAFVTEFGTIYSPNITPDAATGIGSWSEADFLRAMHEGVSADGTALYPAFPYAAYTYLTDADVEAIRAYIFAQPAVSYTPPDNTLRFPYNQRWLMSVWSALYNPNERFQPVADRSAEWNRGAYMVEALGHCGDCHTPRTPLQSLDNRRKFAGGFAEGWRAYNLSSHETAGIGAWSAADLTGYLQTGRAENRGSAFGPMAEAVHLSFKKMTDSDIAAIVEYIRSVPAVDSPDMPALRLEPVSDNPLEGVAAERYPRGLEVFSGACAGCHGWTGENDLVPHSTFTGSRPINDPSAINVALAIANGASSLSSLDGAVASMPAFGDILTDDDIAAVANYVVSRFGASPAAITGAEVAALRAAH